jgi:hypothetical protein
VRLQWGAAIVVRTHFAPGLTFFTNRLIAKENQALAQALHNAPQVVPSPHFS